MSTERQADIRIHGVLGCHSDKVEEGVTVPTGILAAHVVWEYAPESWARRTRSTNERTVTGPRELAPASLESTHYLELEVDGTACGVRPRFPEHGSVAADMRGRWVADLSSCRRTSTSLALDDSSTWFSLGLALGN